MTEEMRLNRRNGPGGEDALRPPRSARERAECTPCGPGTNDNPWPALPIASESLQLTDLLDVAELQRLQDAFSQATGIASIITAPDGRPLTAPSNFTRLCRDVIRGTVQGLANCMRSDALLGRPNPEGPNMQPCHSCGLWDGGATIYAGPHHIGNWLIGQVRNEELDEEGMLGYARAIGADEDDFRSALAEVPRMSTERFRHICDALYNFANQLSQTAYQKMQLAQQVEERRRAELEVRRLNEDLEQRVRQRTKQLEVANRKLQSAKDAAEKANRAKSHFLANMSHEIRTPLNAILGFSHLMQRDAGLSREQRANLDTINRSGEHLLALINDVLEMSKIEAGRAALHPATFDLHALLDDLELMFRVRANGKRLQLLVVRADDLPRYVVGDQNKLRQMLINLLGNAIKFTEQGGVALRASYKPNADAAGRLVIEVEDTGVGIAPEEIKRVFRAFEQSASGRVAHEGTGLGLTITREYARLMGGDIEITSAPDAGSTFRIDVAVAVGRPEDAVRAGAGRRVRRLAPDAGHSRVLVVDDNPDNRTILCQQLAAVGFNTREARNGLEAVNLAASWLPHLVLMDIRMPVMDGLEATRRIKASTTGSDIPVVAVSASVFEEDRDAVHASGCDDFLRKPVHVNRLLDVIRHHLDVRFEYEDERFLPAPVARPAPRATELAARCARLPETLRADLRRAAIELRPAEIAAQIAHIRTCDPELADALYALAEEFAYDRIVEALAPSADAPQESLSHG